ncbi:hypothetical protein GmHk_03G006463 [Glycine max]|nr:hypothetical protein GmHk_03G006463 [Glycine max]
MYDVYQKPIELLWYVTKFGIPDVEASFFITHSDVTEIISNYKCLNMSIRQLWKIAMKTLKTSSTDKYDHSAPHWIEVKWFGGGIPSDIKAIKTIRKKWACHVERFR